MCGCLVCRSFICVPTREPLSLSLYPPSPHTRKNTHAQTVRLGDRDVEWDPSFRLYLATRLPNPDLTPEVCAKTSVVNYALSQPGLARQLLGAVAARERPDLEAARVELGRAIGADRAALAGLEEALLRELSGATGERERGREGEREADMRLNHHRAATHAAKTSTKKPAHSLTPLTNQTNKHDDNTT